MSNYNTPSSIDKFLKKKRKFPLGKSILEKESKIKYLYKKHKISYNSIKFAPTFYPTLEELKTPMLYISKIRPMAEKYGICKIVPPKLFKPFNGRKNLYKNSSKKKFHTKYQEIHKLGDGEGFDSGDEYTMEEYESMAVDFQDENKNLTKSKIDDKYYEKLFFDIIDKKVCEVNVEYGNDVDTFSFGSGFKNNKDKSKLHPFNLNRFPFDKSGILKYLDDNVPGVSHPWIYFGMLFSAFCWHAEDNYLYSINFMHFGKPKLWYGVPGDKKGDLERCFTKYKKKLVQKEPDLILKLVTMLSPLILKLNNIPVYKIVQNEGEYVITFPCAFHAGFNQGFNCAEAVNFADDYWFKFAKSASKKYREYGRAPVVSYEKLLLASIKYGEFDSNKYLLKAIKDLILEQKWIRKFMKIVGITNVLRICSKNEEDKILKFLNIEENNRNKQLSIFGTEGKYTGSEDIECEICKSICFMGFITCKCKGMKRIVCLNHFHKHCSCDISFKSMFIRHTICDLELFLNYLIK